MGYGLKELGAFNILPKFTSYIYRTQRPLMTYDVYGESIIIDILYVPKNIHGHKNCYEYLELN